MTTDKWLKNNTYSLQGKRVAISGATGGIGRELCRYLCMLNAELILLDRNETKSHSLRQELQSEYPLCTISCITLNLELLGRVKEVAEELQEKPLHALILNAGAYHIPRYTCTTGYDNIFQINFVSPYVLARLLLPHLQVNDGKVVAVGSIAHTYSKTNPKDIDFKNQKKHSKAYGNAKRYLMFSLFELFGGKDGLAVTHPGITFTNITAHYPKFVFALIKYPMKIIFMKPRRACLSILRGLFVDCKKNQWIGPRYFRIWGMPQEQILHTCSAHESMRIAEVAEKLYQQVLQ